MVGRYSTLAAAVVAARRHFNTSESASLQSRKFPPEGTGKDGYWHRLR